METKASTLGENLPALKQRFDKGYFEVQEVKLIQEGRKEKDRGSTGTLMFQDNERTIWNTYSFRISL